MNIPPAALEALRLMIEWGADEALQDSPVDRFAGAIAVDRFAGTAPVDRSAQPHALAVVPPASPAKTAPAQPLAPNAPPIPTIEAARSLAATAPDPAALHAAMDGFIACALRGTASTTVAPSGNPAAGLLFLYDAPGPDDDRSGQALAGPAGARFDRVLASAGLDRTHLLVAPLIPWRPPGGRPASDAEIALCMPFLHRLIALLHPSRIVLLGAGPTRTLNPRLTPEADDAPFRKLRGKWSQVMIDGHQAPIPALPMLSPDMWLTSPTNRQATWSDIMTLMASLATD